MEYANDHLWLESDEPLAQIVNDGAKAVVASWGYLNKYIVSGHVDGSICQWNWKVMYPSEEKV